MKETKQTSENREYFKRALTEALEMKEREICEEMDRAGENMEPPKYSRRHRIRMNRMFREHIGSNRIPFPEVDNIWERTRSELVVKVKMNERAERRKKRRKERLLRKLRKLL